LGLHEQGWNPAGRVEKAMRISMGRGNLAMRFRMSSPQSSFRIHFGLPTMYTTVGTTPNRVYDTSRFQIMTVAIHGMSVEKIQPRVMYTSPMMGRARHSHAQLRRSI
jgi:hypothetical protein